jgi:type IV secretory pathway VirB2 component (pilin)
MIRSFASTFSSPGSQRALMWVVLGAGLALLPAPAFAQASPFLTGANSLVTNVLAWLTPIAILVLMALAIAAMANRISWAWPLSAMIGIVIAFGAPQIVTWVRGMFAV